MEELQFVKCELLKRPSGSNVYGSSFHSISHRERPLVVVRSAVVSGHSPAAFIFAVLVYQKYAWENEKTEYSLVVNKCGVKSQPRTMRCASDVRWVYTIVQAADSIINRSFRLHIQYN